MSDTRYIQIDGQKAGPFTLYQLGRMARAGEIGPQSQFWSDREGRWLPLTTLMKDVEPGTTIEKFRASHCTHIEILGTGSGEDCAACEALFGKAYKLDATPSIPPEGCTCIPWCRCVMIAVRDPNAPSAEESEARLRAILEQRKREGSA